MGVNLLTDSAKCCLNLQVALDETCSTPAGKMESTGMMAGLTSDYNRSGFEQLTGGISDVKCKPVGGATPPKVEVKIEKPNCGDIGDTCPSLCDPGAPTEDPYLYLEPCVDMVVSATGRITKDEFCDLCETPNERLAVTTRRLAERLKQGMNAKLAEQAYALMGNYTSGVLSTATPAVLPVLNPAGHINAAAWAKMKSEFRKMGCIEAPVVVGGDILAQIEDITALGGVNCCDNGANRQASQNLIRSYYDSQIDSTLQALAADSESHVLSWSRGALQLLEWYKNKGVYEEFKEDYTETTIVIDGVRYDYQLRYNECDKVWDFSLCKCFGLFCIPDEAYQPCYDTNHKLHWIISCGETDCTSFSC